MSPKLRLATHPSTLRVVVVFQIFTETHIEVNHDHNHWRGRSDTHESGMSYDTKWATTSNFPGHQMYQPQFHSLVNLLKDSIKYLHIMIYDAMVYLYIYTRLLDR